MHSHFLMFATLFCAAHAATISWTGIINDQQWGTANNWYPAQIPGKNDDVVINDAEGKDATVVLVDPTAVKSLTVGAGTSGDARLRVLASLRMTGDVAVGPKGVLEINSGSAVVSCVNGTVAGELEFAAGSLIGNYAVTGFANFGGQAAKIFDTATVKVTSARAVAAAGSMQFKRDSKVTANSGVVASGQNTQFIVMDKSTENAFQAKGFSWTQ